MRASENKFYSINDIVNANSIEMVDQSKWIKWSLDRLKDGLSKRKVNKIASLLTT